MSQIDAATNSKPTAPHNEATIRYKNVHWYVLSGMLVLFIIASYLIFHFHYNIGWLCFISQSLTCLGIGMVQWAYKDLTQIRLLSGAVDRDWYNTNTNELNNTAHQLTSELGLRDIKVRIGLVDIDFETYSIMCSMNGTITISIRILKEFEPDEVKFLLACSVVNFRRNQFLDTRNYLYFLVPFCIIAFPFFLTGYFILGTTLCILVPNILSPVVGMVKHKFWIKKIPGYKVVLAYTRNYMAAKSALSRISNDDKDEESILYSTTNEMSNSLYIAAKELGLVS